MAPSGSPYKLGAVLPDRVDDKWDAITPLLNKWLANTFGEYILTDVNHLLKTGEWQCWTVSKDGKLVAVALTEIASRPRMKVLHVVGVAGTDAKGWVHLLEDIEDWAKINGCSRITGAGRVGWEKVMKPFGFQKMYSVIMKEI